MSTSSYDTRWARRKLERARAHLADLEHAIAGWVDPRTYPLDLVLADDGRRVDVALVLDELPPLEDWSLIVGDCAQRPHRPGCLRLGELDRAFRV